MAFTISTFSEPETSDKAEYVKYPDTLREAKEFVVKYKNQARK